MVVFEGRLLKTYPAAPTPLGVLASGSNIFEGFIFDETAPAPLPALIELVGIPSGEAHGTTQVIPAPLVVYITPPRDTLRGGTQVTIYADRAFTTTAYDAALVAGVSGSGGFAADTGIAATGPTAGSTAGATHQDTFTHFDCAVTAEFLSPPNSPTDYTPAALEVVHIATGDTARVYVTRAANGVLTAHGDILRGAVVEPGGVAVLPAGSTTVVLRLVRGPTRLYGFVDEIELLNTPTFTPGLCQPRFATRNGAGTTAVRTRYTGFELRSHATIAGRLVVNKINAEARHLIANVPAATISELGLTDVEVFGPWGAVTLNNGFEYVLPAPSTLSNDGSRQLTTYLDPVLHDAS